ncbi:MAG: 30S ribosomal protein S21 [Verrucomicrobiales bacterium]
MTKVSVKKGEPIDRALKRLKSKLETEGILEEMRRLRAFETPVERLRRKARANAKRGRNNRIKFSLYDEKKPKPEDESGSPTPANTTVTDVRANQED